MLALVGADARGRARRSPRPAASPSPTTTRPARSSSPARATRSTRPRRSPASAARARSALDVAGAFHSPRDGAGRRAVPRRARRGRARTSRASPSSPARPPQPFADVRAELAERSDTPVRWRETVHRPARGRRALASSRSAPARCSPAWASASCQGVPGRDPRRRSLSMRSAALPPELAPDRPRGDPQRPPRRRRRAPPRSSASATTCRRRSSPTAPIAERIGVDDDVDRQAHRHPRAPPRRAERAHDRPAPRSPAAARCRTRASTRATSTSCSSRR